MSALASFGPQVPGSYDVDRRRRVEQRLHDPPLLLDAVLTCEPQGLPVHRGLEQHLVRRRALTALVGELHVEADRLHRHRVRPPRLELEPDAGAWIEADHQLIGLRRARRACRSRGGAGS